MKPEAWAPTLKRLGIDPRRRPWGGLIGIRWQTASPLPNRGRAGRHRPEPFRCDREPGIWGQEFRHLCREIRVAFSLRARGALGSRHGRARALELLRRPGRSLGSCQPMLLALGRCRSCGRNPVCRPAPDGKSQHPGHHRQGRDRARPFCWRELATRSLKSSGVDVVSGDYEGKRAPPQGPPHAGNSGPDQQGGQRACARAGCSGHHHSPHSLHACLRPRIRARSRNGSQARASGPRSKG